jgi:hypothetical protein
LEQAEIGTPGVQAGIHVVSATRLPRRWPTCPQLGGRLNHSKAPTSETSSINFPRVERRASALRIAVSPGAGSD